MPKVLPARSPNGIEDLDSQKIYSKSLLESYFKKVDLLAVYSNILGVIADSETIDSLQNTRAAPCIRALVSDLKRYMRVQVSINNQRILPVGVQAADMMTLAIPQVMYMTAGSPEERVDFYCHNNYHWASPSDMQTSGWNQDVTMYSRFPVPMFISEYGTKVGRDRSFQETTALYSPAMTRVFSGGFVWEFLSLEEHELSNRGDSVTGHGIVRINTKGEFLRTTKEFRALKKRLKYVMNPLHASYKKQGGPAMEFGETDVHDLCNDILDTEDSWRGSFPQVSNQWQPRLERMPSLLDWMSLEKRILDHHDTEWVIVEKMSDLLLQTEQYENE